MDWLGAFTGGPAKDAAAANTDAFNRLKKKGMEYLDTGLTNSTGAINAGLGTFKDLGTKYGAGTNLYLDSLGVNGAAGNTRAQNAFTAGPSYQWQVDQALDAVNRGAAARGMLRSGNTVSDTVKQASGLAGAEYGNWQNRLAGLMTPEIAAAGGTGDLSKSLASLHQTDANARVGLATNVTGGIANANNMAANAEMAGSNNLFNFGLNLAKLGTGMAGYGSFGGTLAPGEYGGGTGGSAYTIGYGGRNVQVY